MQEFDFDIVYKPGKTNVVADALSRRPDFQANAVTSLNIQPAILQQIQEGYEEDKYFSKVLPHLKDTDQPVPREFHTKIKKFKLQNGLLYFGDPARLCIPSTSGLRLQLLQEHHDTPFAAHFGFDKTYEAIQRIFYWPNMHQDVKNFVTSCDLCQRNKSSTQQPQGLLQPLPIPTANWQQISMDFIVQLPKTKANFDAIVVFVDRLSKQVHFQPTTTDATAPDIAHIFFNTIFRYHGLPTTIIYDRDAKFTSNFWSSLFKILGTKIAMSTAFHPETDCQTERTNRTLEQILRIFVSYKQDDWDHYLAFAEFAYNNAKQKSTSMSPFYLTSGQNPKTPAALLDQSHVPAVQDFTTQMANLYKIAQDNISLAQDQQAYYANQHRREETFKIGDQVLLSTANINIATQNRRPARKLQAKFIGPYTIQEVISPVAYKLALPDTLQVHPVFHISLLKKYHQNPSEFAGRSIPPPPKLTFEDHDEYLVEKILDKRIRYNQPEYLVKWLGYPDYDSTWEPLANLTNSQWLLDQFENNL